MVETSGEARQREAACEHPGVQQEPQMDGGARVFHIISIWQVVLNNPVLNPSVRWAA